MLEKLWLTEEEEVRAMGIDEVQEAGMIGLKTFNIPTKAGKN